MLNKGIYLSTEDILVKVWDYESEAERHWRELEEENRALIQKKDKVTAAGITLMDEQDTLNQAVSLNFA